MRRLLPFRIAAKVREAKAAAATLHYKVVTRPIVELCHAQGVAVWAWTVNDARSAERMATAGVDAIISDDPRILSGHLFE
jgi:glycerophosphoryl diester phosphodiesterase